MTGNTKSGSRGSAVIVGAGPGTGAEVAKLLASEGYAVVVSRRNQAALASLVRDIEERGGRALAVAADAAKPDQVRGLFDEAEAKLGAPEIVLFNAAGFTMGSILETSPEAFEDMWRASAFGGFVVGREAARRMLPHGHGTILFTGATAAVKASAKFSAFAAGKHGLRAVAQSMAKELGPQGIHVAHVIVDGVIDVPRVTEEMPNLAGAKGEDGLLDPRAIAQTFLWLHRQPRNAWSFELDLRPFSERW